jgi:hypothetical protein
LNGDLTLLGGAAGSDPVPAAQPAAFSPPPAAPSEGRPVSAPLQFAITGAQAARLLGAIGPLDGVRITDALHADIVLNTDSGILGNAQNQTLFNFGHSQTPSLYVGVLTKWLLAKSVSSRANLSVDAAVKPVRARYAEGDKADVAISANQPGYVVAFDMGADGSISLLEPDPTKPAGRLSKTDAAGRSQIAIELSPPAGTDHIFVAVTPEEPFDLMAALRRLNGRAPGKQDMALLRSLFEKYSRQISMVEFYTDGRGVR